MRRYFMVNDRDMPTIKEDFGAFHYVDLASHGPAGDQWNLLCLIDEHVQSKEAWIAFPPLYDSKTTLAASAVPHELLADIGLTGDETCIEAICKLREISPIVGL